MRTLTTVILFLVVALLIQNTCPLGAAGKSAVTRACSDCLLKQKLVTEDGRENLVPGASSAHFPLFIFSVPRTIPAFRLIALQSVSPMMMDQYQDALPDELLRPPHA